MDSFFRHARAHAKKARHRLFKHVAFVVRGGSIIAQGVNHDWVHAEVQALNKLWPSERRGTKVYSMRFTRGGKLTNGKPCEACVRYMKESGVKTVLYSDSSGEMQMERI